MRKLYFFFALSLLFSLSFNLKGQEVNKRFKAFSNLDLSGMKTNVLYDMAIQHSPIEKLTGAETSPVIKASVWKQVYFELDRASVKKQLPDIMDLVKKNNEYVRQNIYPIAILDYEYDRITQEAIKNGWVKREGKKLIQTKSANILETNRVFAASALSSRTYGRLTVNYVIPEDMIFSNRKDKIQAIYADFGDGRGFVQVTPNKVYTVKYKSEGEKQIKIKAILASKADAISTFTINVKDTKMPSPSEDWVNFTADIPWNGAYASGEVAILYGAGNSTLTRPVIVVDGFDPGDSRPVSGLYELANKQNMLETLRSRGYDAVLVNFYDGAGYIQRNAMLVVKVIQTVINRMKAAGTYTSAPQIVVIGPSMGGLITRYALRYMEMHGMEHHVRTWISFDSPQKGANVPLGLQYWVHFFADVADAESAQEAQAALLSPAAQQMLIYHFYYYAYNQFSSFYNEINSMGFPQLPRKVAIINGSGYGLTQPFNPGDQVIYYHYRSWLVDLDGNVWAVPDWDYHIIFQGLYDTFLPFDETKWTIYLQYSYPYDNAPGGYTNTFQEIGNTDPGYGDIINYYDNHCFIPTFSSLALENVSYPIINVNSSLSWIQTPFDKIYYPYYNQMHVDITPESAQWFYNEITGYKTEEQGKDVDWLAANTKIYPNPTDGPVNITFPDYGKREIAIYDLSGHELYHTVATKSVLTINPQLQAGTYLIKITTDNGSITKRLIVK